MCFLELTAIVGVCIYLLSTVRIPPIVAVIVFGILIIELICYVINELRD